MLLLLPLALGFKLRVFLLPFFVFFFHVSAEPNHKGGEVMDDDVYMFEMFQQMMQQLEEDPPANCMRVLIKNPRYTADDPAKTKIKTEKR